MDYEKELERALAHADKVKLRRELYEIRHANDKKKEPLSFGKIGFIFVFVDCIVVELYSMFAMLWLRDLSALGGLIAAVVCQAIDMISYNHKSSKENTSGGIVFETAMKKLEAQEEDQIVEEDDDAVG